jgi:hypothetical protein
MILSHSIKAFERIREKPLFTSSNIFLANFLRENLEPNKNLVTFYAIELITEAKN